MKVNKIKINSYGKINNREFEFKKVNIIYGKNESGKSTMQNYMISMLYNISKNKNGKIMSDYDRYLPWNSEEFSGKMDYELDNGRRYSVFRDFLKKNPEIYDENGNDISKQFNIDKKIGNTFFLDQVKIDREIMESTVISAQAETKIDSNRQNLLIQKVANLADSGDEDISYKKAIQKLDKLLLTEVGTEKSQDRPINVTKENIVNYKMELNKLKEAKEQKYYVEERANNIKERIRSVSEEKAVYEDINNVIKNNKEEQEKLKIKENIIEENNKKIERYKAEKSKLSKNKNVKVNLIILLIIVLINVVSLIFIKKLLVNILIAILIPIWLGVMLLKNKRNNSKNIDIQIELLSKSNNEISDEINIIDNKLEQENLLRKNTLKAKYGKQIEKLFDDDIDYRVEKSRKDLQELQLELHKLELDMQYIEPKIDRILELEEKLGIEEENLSNLQNKSESYGLAKSLMEEAYIEMKNNITPKFNQDLSKNVDKISNGKYKKIILNDGIQVELDNGKHISLESFSTGTIEQIYLAFRLSVIYGITKETMPILLDETFAYYDIERLKSTLRFLNDIENQVIIFTCTQREREALDFLNIKYNYIEL